MKKLIPFILVALSINSANSQNLLFKSGFETSVQIDPPIALNNQWYHTMSGQDQGYDWATGFLPFAYSTYWRHLVDNDSVLTDYVNVEIDTVIGPYGNQTNALFSQIKKYSPTNFSGQFFGTVRNQFILEWDTTRQQAYCKYWIKLQPDLYGVMPAGINRWRQIMEWRESGGIYGDYRWAFSVLTNTTVNDSIFWMLGTQYITGPSTFVDDWSVSNKTVPVPIGQWFLLEVYWNQQNNNTGRIWIAIDSTVIFDVYADNENNSSIFDWHLFKTYTGKQSIDSGYIYQWIDDVEIWDSIPTIATSVQYNSSSLNSAKVYPNPFSSTTTLQADKILKNATLTVYDSFGQIVNHIDNLSRQKIVFHRDNLPTGLYFVRLTEDNKIIAVDKLIITDK